MGSMPAVTWVGLSLTAAVLWGLQYSLWGYLLKTVSPLAGLWWYSVVSVLLYSLFLGIKGIPVEYGAVSGWRVVGVLLALGLIGFMANVCTITGFKMANPTVVAMIVGSAPLFSAAFAYLLFRNVDVNPMTVVGFLLILAGVGVVAWSKQG